MAIFLMQMSLSAKPGLNYLEYHKARLLRLVPAYLAWSLGYVLVRYFKRVFLTGRSFEVDWVSVIFFGGASYQLYFIPMLILLTLLFTPLMRCLIWSSNYVGSGALCFIAGVSMIGVLSGIPRWYPPPGYEMVVYMKGAIGYGFWGMGIWALWEGFKRKGAAERRWIPACIGSLLLALIALHTDVLRHWFVPLYSLCFFLAALYAENRYTPVLIKYLAPMAFGIYMVHGFFVEGLQTVLHLGGFDLSGFGITSGIIVMSFASSALLCSLLKRIRLTRWLVI